MNRFTYYSLFGTAYAAYTAMLCLSLAFLHLTWFESFAIRYWYVGATIEFFLFWGLARSLAWLEEALWIQVLVWIYAFYTLVVRFIIFRGDLTYTHTVFFSRWARGICDLLPVVALLCVRTPAVKPYCTFYAVSQLAEFLFLQVAGWWGFERPTVMTRFVLVLQIFRWLLAMIILFFFLRMVLYSREPDPLQEAIDRIGQGPPGADPGT